MSEQITNRNASAKSSSPEIEIAGAAVPPSKGAAVAVCVFSDEPRLTQSAEGASSLWRRTCETLLVEEGFEGKADTTLFLHLAGEAASDGNERRTTGQSATDESARSESAADKGGSGTDEGEAGGSAGGGLLNARRVLLVGLGAHDEVNRAALARAAGMAARVARENRVSQLFFVLPEVAGASDRETASAIVEGTIFGLYDNDFYQAHDEETTRIERLTLVAGAGAEEELKSAVERARIVAEAVNWTRALSDEPGASLPPREFARRAAEMAAEYGLKVESLMGEEVRARGMGGLAGVGQGSENEPALIVVRYEPEDATEADELWAFVGKGITFDTGGISIKHGLDMYEMKADMAGGAAALGALRAIAQLKPRRRVVAVVPAAENMPSSNSIKPGDIVRTFAGYTIEVVDTDAEGRLVLADGLAYARSLGATRIVDLATLTGSIVSALGDHRAGLFSNDDEWAARVRAASERAGEPVWPMPVSDDYKKRIESDIADFKNYGGRPDATAAALLLSKFAADTPWVHLDIAGTSWYDAAQPHAPAGSTGTGVRTLVELTCEDACA